MLAYHVALISPRCRCVRPGTAGMHAVFVAEFEELPSRLRPGKVRVDTRGVHGNAILSTFPIDRVWTVHHPNGFNWERYSPLLLQPRMGHRVTLGAEVSVPTGGGVQKARVYSLHLECVAGSRVRMLQLADVLVDAQQQRRRHGSAVNVFGGDANTLLTGMMKWNPLCVQSLSHRSCMCCDPLTHALPHSQVLGSIHAAHGRPGRIASLASGACTSLPTKLAWRAIASPPCSWCWWPRAAV